MQRSSSAAFLTITYDEEHVPLFDEVIKGKEFLIGKKILVKRHLQLFIKRLRKKQAKLSNDKLVYYACGEYGGLTNRPHYHIILFNLHPSLMFDGVLGDIWKMGDVRVDECNIQTIQYTTKYVMKSHNIPDPDYQQEFSLMSKGIGTNFLTPQMTKFYQNDPKNYVIWKDGQKLSMPRYYKEKLYDEDTQRRLGKEALENVKPELLDGTKVFEIKQMNKNLERLQNEKRGKI